MLNLRFSSPARRLAIAVGAVMALGMANAFAESYQFHYKAAGMKPSKEPAEYDFSSHTFTNCGVSGLNGPGIANCLSAYAGANFLAIEGAYGVSSGIQEWLVPETAVYRIEAYGGRGGRPMGVSDTYRGPGAVMKGDFRLAKGQRLKVVVGQEGGANTDGNIANGGGTGGGGSFVWVAGESQPLIVAGGGGGAAIINTTGSQANLYGVGGTTGQDGTTSRAVNLLNQGRNGGNATYTNGARGWLTMSSTGNFAGRTGSYGRISGFGGGGLGQDGDHGAGGGGGYSGGGGGYYGMNYGGNADGRNGGGGGGSFNAGTNQANGESVNHGHGKVIITKL
jgi:hypothetical protein